MLEDHDISQRRRFHRCVVIAIFHRTENSSDPFLDFWRNLFSSNLETVDTKISRLNESLHQVNLTRWSRHHLHDHALEHLFVLTLPEGEVIDPHPSKECSRDRSKSVMPITVRGRQEEHRRLGDAPNLSSRPSKRGPRGEVNLGITPRLGTPEQETGGTFRR